MTPEYPVGAISVVVETPAIELKPGDVASVLREGSTVLVTHRVVAVVPTLDDPSRVELILKGDANSSQDPLPYRVATAKKVVFTVPALGAWIMAMKGPWFLGVATVLLTALVVWAFWPKRQRRPETGQLRVPNEA